MNRPQFTIEQLLMDDSFGLNLRIEAGERGLANTVSNPRIQKPGLALAGYAEHIHTERIQILGNTEISYLRQLPEEVARTNVDRFCALPISCIVVTKGLALPQCLTEAANRNGVPLLVTPHLSSTFISLVTRFLEERLLPSTHVHGVLVDVFGVGVLLLGKSGIGKSECALDLVLRGHKLVADDMVLVRKKMPASLGGEAGAGLAHHMEIRGLGVINIKDLFGITSVRAKKIINLVMELVEWDADDEYDRMGIDELVYTILGVDLPYLRIPIRSGRSLGTIVEVAARNHLLKENGCHTAKEFQERLLSRLVPRSSTEEVE